MCSKCSVSTPPHSSTAPLLRLRTTEGTPRYTARKLSQKSNTASSTLQRETREITQESVTQLSAAFVISPQITVFIYSNREKLFF